MNLELVERIDSSLTLISSEGGAGRYNFPHTVAQELIREALEPTTSGGTARSDDVDLGILYTADQDSNGTTLGSIGVVLRPGGQRQVWRFGDRSDQALDFTQARELV